MSMKNKEVAYALRTQKVDILNFILLGKVSKHSL